MPGRNRFLTERDVLAADSKGRLFMISCKTAGRIKGAERKTVLAELEAMAKTLGSFVIPVLCSMTTDPPALEDGILCLAWTTLCRPADLLAALEMAAKNERG